MGNCVNEDMKDLKAAKLSKNGYSKPEKNNMSTKSISSASK
jgi:hypothetical protein